MSLANDIIKEFDELEESRREEQYRNVLENFQDNLENGTGYSLFYYSILYDEVRERLENDGFKVKVITTSSDGRPAYNITRKEDFVIKENVEIIR